MGEKGGELSIETGRYVMPEPKLNKKTSVSNKHNQPKAEDPYSITPYSDYIGGYTKTSGRSHP